MTQYTVLIALVCSAGLAYAGEEVPAGAPPDAPGAVEILESSPGPDVPWDLTPVRFSLRGPYTGKVEFSQHKTVRYHLWARHVSASRAEYQVALPAVFEDIRYKVSTGTATRGVNPVLMQSVSSHDPALAGLFEAPVARGSMKVKAVLIAALYVVCISQLLRLPRGLRRASAVAVATLAFSAAEVILVWNRVETSSATLHEGRPGFGVCSYEFIGIGSPWGGRTTIAREEGVLFPIHRTMSEQFGEDLDVQLDGRGSIVEELDIERGNRRTFCCISAGGLDGGLAFRGDDVVNATGMDVHVYLLRDGTLYEAGRLSAGSRIDAAEATPTTEEDILSRARELLTPAATSLLSWRLSDLDSTRAIIGLVAPSRVIVLEEAGDADIE